MLFFYKPRPVPASPFEGLYHSVSTTPLSIFITALTGNKAALVITAKAAGRYTTQALDAAWQALYYEYLDVTYRPPAAEYYFKLQAEEALLVDEVTTVETGVYYLSPAVEPFITPAQQLRITIVLKKYGYKITLNDNLISQLNTTLNRLAPKKMRLTTIRKELEANNKSEGGTKPVTAGDFYAILRRLSKYMGFNIRAADITVLEYAGLVTDYVKELEAKRAAAESKKF